MQTIKGIDLKQHRLTLSGILIPDIEQQHKIKKAFSE